MEPLLRTAPLPPVNDRQCAYCRRIFCNRVTRRNHRCPGVLETQQLPPITIGSAVVEWVDSFKYLGHVLNSDLSDSLDFETRIRKAQAMYGAVSKFLNATGKIRRSFRIHLFRAVVEATLMYGGVLWSLSAAERDRLNAFQMKCLRGICGMLPKKLPDGTFLWPHNEDVLKKAKQIPLTKWWKERQLVLAQHILKWPDDDPCRAAMGWSLPDRILTDYKAKKTWGAQMRNLIDRQADEGNETSLSYSSSRSAL